MLSGWQLQWSFSCFWDIHLPIPPPLHRGNPLLTPSGEAAQPVLRAARVLAGTRSLRTRLSLNRMSLSIYFLSGKTDSAYLSVFYLVRTDSAYLSGKNR